MICIVLVGVASSDFYSDLWRYIFFINFDSAVFDSLESFINDCYMRRCYCASGVVVACDTA